MKVRYVRVSTTEQNTARQDVLMESLGVEKVYVDKASGKDTDRLELQSMLAFVREGDVVVTESYSRISRSLRDLLDIVDKLKTKGVEFISQKKSIDTLCLMLSWGFGTPVGILLCFLQTNLFYCLA